MGIKDSRELARQDWLGQRAVRPRGGPLAAPLGRGVRRLRGRREALLAARDGPPDLPGRRLGRARRRPRRRPRQLGAALPHHLGHRPRCRRALRAAGARARRDRPDPVRLPAPGRRPARRGRHRASASAAPCSSRSSVERGTAEQPGRGRRLRAPRAGRDRHQRRHRRQPRPGPQGLAGAARRRRRRRWSPAYPPTSTAGCSASPRRPAPASSTRTGCGTTSRASATGTRSGTTTASGSCPARRRSGSTRPASGCPRRTSRASTPSARCTHLRTTGYDYSWFVLTQKIIEKEFALSGSEQNPDLTGKDVKLAAVAGCKPGAPGPVEAFKQHGEDFVVADNLDRAGRRHERGRRRRGAGARRGRAARR